MIQWLYRYVFRGIGIALIAGMITILFLAISSQTRRSADGKAASATGTRR